jgi:hypothetical protein
MITAGVPKVDAKSDAEQPPMRSSLFSFRLVPDGKREIICPSGVFFECTGLMTQ